MIEQLVELTTDITPAKSINYFDENEKAECKETVRKLINILTENSELESLSAPQIGIDKKVFCINFNGTIKTFIDPIIIKKTNNRPTIETCANFPTKEYLVIRPDEINAIYINEEGQQDSNKFLGVAAAIFDQQVQLLDGVLPSEIGLESDIELDGKLADLTEEEFNEAVKMLQKISEIRLAKAEEEIKSNKALTAAYDNLRFSEQVITGKIEVVDTTPPPHFNREVRRKFAKKLNYKKGQK